MKKQLEVKFYHVGDEDYNGTLLITLSTKKAALEYVKDWLQAHNTVSYPFHRVGADRWESKFTAIYIVTK